MKGLVPFIFLSFFGGSASIFLSHLNSCLMKSGYLQSFFGVYSVRIENAGVRRPSSDDLQIQGITNPSAFRKVNVVPVNTKLNS